ncbi:MAG: outer membrane lipoprotein carrier protein LolA [Planktomarina sp.]|nr:outer membrane lipoprotein carrier protein LolA [Planktomarina sp.]
MKYILFLLIILAVPAHAEKISLAQISSYLNKLGTAEANFTQFNDDKSISTGKLIIKRPGRIRFEYDLPSLALVVVGGGQVAVFDPKANEGPTRFPLSQTPLKIILENKVDLGQEDMVVGHMADGLSTILILQDPKHPNRGAIQLIFSENPIKLRQWIVDDNEGNVTKVIIEDWTEGQRISNVLFNIQAEMQKRAR